MVRVPTGCFVLPRLYRGLDRYVCFSGKGLMYRRRFVNFQKPNSGGVTLQSVFLLCKNCPNENGIFYVANSFVFKNNSPKSDRQLFFLRRVSPHLCPLATGLRVPWNNIPNSVEICLGMLASWLHQEIEKRNTAASWQLLQIQEGSRPSPVEYRGRMVERSACLDEQILM
jgi:hypothetical protein